ncbi:unnamed protein product [Lasius platythorax]|uniref:Uncharacterized protein n=1 Tax=Lasius platythorax TaxID=488582 RepID=A0AAV2MVJ0_9HYME
MLKLSAINLSNPQTFKQIQTKSKEPTIQDIWKILQSIQQKAISTERRLELLEKSKSPQNIVKNNKKKK